MMILGGIAAAILQPIRIPSTFGGVVSAVGVEIVAPSNTDAVELETRIIYLHLTFRA